MAQSLELLLIQFLMPDNDARRQAEEQIRRLARDPQVVPALVHHLRTAKTPNVRQLAAVLLRKKITSHWPKLPPHAKASLKQALIDSITLDHSHLVRRASANVVSIIAKYAVPAGEWPELLPFLFQCSQSPQEDHREVALIMFSSLTETIGTTFQSHLNDLQPILLKSLQDETSSRVRIAALKAVGSFIEYVNDGGDIVKMFRDFVPSILNVSRQCLANGEEDVASIAFEIFDELIESPAPLLGDSVRSIVQFSLEVCSNQDLEINIRQQAIQIISWLVKFKASFLKKHKLVVPILQVMCPLLTETANEDEDSDLAADRSAAEVIDTMAINLPRHVIAPVLEFALVNFRHTSPKYREAAVTSLGVVSEGCCEHLKDKLEDCLKIVLEALKDQEQMVRGAASFALGQFAEHLQPEILSHYESVLPCILNALEDPSDEVKEKSYYALAAFCEDMGEDILPYLDPLICRLVMSLQSSPRNLQETCMSAIGSLAAAAEQAFIPYAEKVLEMMKGFMALTNDEGLCARARATEVVGIVAMAVGRARMEAILPPFIEAAISGFGLDYSELREYTHGFFSNVAEILDDSFAQYLPHVVPLVFSSCNLDDGSAVDIDDADSVDNGFSGVSSDDDVNDEPRVRNISVRTGVLDEKAAATQAIGFFALHTKSAYAPYLEESLKILIRHSGYFHEDVRLQAIISLKHILTSVRAISHAHADVIEKQKDVLDTVMNIYIKTMTEDDDKEVVAQACMSVADIVKDCGFAPIEPCCGYQGPGLAWQGRPQEAVRRQFLRMDILPVVRAGEMAKQASQQTLAFCCTRIVFPCSNFYPLVYDCNRLFPPPPFPREVEMMESDPNVKRILYLSIECINTLNEGLLLHHASVGCPKPQWSKYLSFLKSRRFSDLTKPKNWNVQEVENKKTLQQVALSNADSKHPKIHTLFSTECSSYFDWQTVGLMHSFHLSRQPGNITRLLSCADEDLKNYKGHDLAPTHYVPSMNRHPLTGDWYPAINKPAAVLHWLNHVQTDAEFIVILDADMIMRGPITPWEYGAKLGHPVSTPYEYLIGCDNILAKMHTRNPSACDKVGRES